ncbi:MAG: PHP-associated domain-containing protein [Thermoplasmata archaeon]|nr:PHP-associated domain-containing protein [Thermoplasmata archaeon]
MGKADTHLHTEYSGFQKLGFIKFPESVAQPERQVDKARQLGLDVLCVTDHDETHGAFIAQKYAQQKYDDIDVVVGEEVTTADGEVIGLFLTERIPEMLSVEETIDRIREQGGLTIAPHPFSFHVPGLKERVLDLDLDGIEVINGGHPDAYTNMFARTVVDRYPGRWAETSGSDAHSKYTIGYNWTEFPGNTADDLRKAILNKTTKACGQAAPVFGQVQWSVDVVIGGQKLMYKSLTGRLKNVPKDHLIEKINSISDLYKATGIFAGFLYVVPPISFIATIMSTSYLKKGSAKMIESMPERLEHIDALIAEVDANGGPGKCRPKYLDEKRDNPLAEYEGLPFKLPFKVSRNK